MIKSSSLFKRVFLLISSTVLLMVGIIDFIVIQNQKHSLVEVMHSKTKTIAKSISLACSDAMITDDKSFMVEHLYNVLEDNQEIDYAFVKEQNGDTIFAKEKSWSMMQTLPVEIEGMLSDKEDGSILATELSPKKVYNYLYPVNFGGVQWGWVNIAYSLNEYNQQMQTFYIHMMIIIFLIFMGSIVYSYLLAKWLVSPILRLSNAAEKVAAGNFDTRVEIHSNDEIGQLTSSFNEMIDALRLSDSQLRTINEDLEQRVLARTEELNILNRELDERVKKEVSKQAQQEQMLIQQSRFAAMGEMVGNIAHQWRQPLNALSLLIQNIETAYEEQLLDKEYIAHTISKSNRLIQAMSTTIDDFRNFFKPNKKIEIFSVASAVGVSLDIVKSSLFNNHIEVIEEIDDTLYIQGFSSEFAQVILNLLSNAKDAVVQNSIENAQIRIKVYQQESSVMIEIIDNGGGVSQDIIEKIFDPYFTTKDEGQGTGIGLYMSKTIIENNMKGSLKVENREDGAKFIIEIKLVEPNNAYEKKEK